MVVHNRAVVGRPHLQHGHAPRAQSLVRKQLKSDVVGSGIDLFKQTSSRTKIFHIEKFIVLIILHLVEMVEDANWPFSDLFAAFFYVSVAIRPNQAILNGKPQVPPNEVLQSLKLLIISGFEIRQT